TDRIIPARYLRAITFEGLGEHAFEDDRKSGDHPFDDARFRGASILIANANFGCGSSREHAPQALMRWGIKGIVGESFAEIFHGNCTAMGLPCVTARPADVQALMGAVGSDPAAEVAIDLKDRTVTCGDLKIPVQIPEGARVQLLEGAWDATGMLLEASDVVRQVAKRLPYISGF
ncbi:MAG: 3-isopropylmalate dehydratase small subunit, partial [Deltaproteobacteria bacterium]|nr:3-isopropylmalate dehydratase small subunit [Deltaproteobacteria bacterium]